MLKTFVLHYRRRQRTGIYSATVMEHSRELAREAIIEYEASRGYKLTRFMDEPVELTREDYD